jgi:hypothetical protein
MTEVTGIDFVEKKALFIVKDKDTTYPPIVLTKNEYQLSKTINIAIESEHKSEVPVFGQCDRGNYLLFKLCCEYMKRMALIGPGLEHEGPIPPVAPIKEPRLSRIVNHHSFEIFESIRRAFKLPEQKTDESLPESKDDFKDETDNTKIDVLRYAQFLGSLMSVANYMGMVGLVNKCGAAMAQVIMNTPEKFKDAKAMEETAFRKSLPEDIPILTLEVRTANIIDTQPDLAATVNAQAEVGLEVKDDSDAENSSHDGDGDDGGDGGNEENEEPQAAAAARSDNEDEDEDEDADD